MIPSFQAPKLGLPVRNSSLVGAVVPADEPELVSNTEPNFREVGSGATYLP